MKNIVKVLRFKDNAVRLYEVPTSIVLERGIVVDVEYGDAGSTALGVTVSSSYCGIAEERMICDVLNIRPGTNFRRVVAVYDKQDITWSDDGKQENTEDAEG